MSAHLHCIRFQRVHLVIVEMVRGIVHLSVQILSLPQSLTLSLTLPPSLSLLCKGRYTSFIESWIGKVAGDEPS